MKKVSKFSLVFMLALIVFSSFAVNSTYAATVGTRLTTPETGWIRYDDNSEFIKYTGTWATYPNGNTLYGGSASHTMTVGDDVTFYFEGTQLRIIGDTWDNKTKTAQITIDDTAYTFTENMKIGGQTLVFEKTGLEDKLHKVTVKLVNNDGYLSLDAVDLNSTGKMVNEPVVEPEPEPTPTPTPEPENGNRAILVVTMITGLEKEFDLSMTEVNDFISWYEAKQAGTGKASYAIDKHDNNKGPFSSRKDYVIFDKILTFEVSEYSN